MADKNVKINFKTTADARGARDAEKGIKKVKDTAKDTEQALDAVEDSARDIRRELDKLDGLDPKVRKEVEKLSGSLNKAAVSGRQMASAQGSNAKSNKNAGLAALEFSRAVEDAQYGVRGILNNIPQLVQFMGGGAGLAGAISLAAVGLTQLVEHLTKTDEAVKKTSGTIEVAREQIDEFYEKAAEDGTSGLRTQISSIIEQLDNQSDALSRNTKLLQDKRKAEMEIAKLTEDLALQEITRAEVNLEITPEQAAERRKQIAISRLQSKKEEEILKSKEKVELLEKQRFAAAEQKVKLEQEIAQREKQFAEERDKRNSLQALKEQAQKRIEAGEEKKKETRFFFNVGESAGAEMMRQGSEMFGEQEREALARQEARVKALEDSITQLKEARLAAEAQQLNLSIAQGEAFNILKITEETETKTAEIQEQILEAKDSTQAAQKARSELSSGVAELKKAAQDSSNLVEVDRERVETANEQMRKIMADDTLTAQELGQTSQVLGRLTGTVVGATKENTQMIQRLQATVDQLGQTIATTKAENINLTQRLNNQNKRR